jgi:ribonuclease HI
VRIRVETDGASRGNPGEAAGAAVLYDADGRMLLRVGRYLGRATNNVAEYEGLLAGLEAAVELGADEVEVRADSELMVRQLNGLYQVRNQGLRPLYEEALRRLAAFRAHRVVHVPREQNRAADRAANDAVDRRRSFRETPDA